MHFAGGEADLTQIMQESSASARFDLACGYPLDRLPKWVTSTVRQVGERDWKGLLENNIPSGAEVEQLHGDLVYGLQTALGGANAIFQRAIVSPSGSLSLDRTISALAAGRTPVAIAPEIDIIHQMLARHTGAAPIILRHTLAGAPALDAVLQDFFQRELAGRFLLCLSTPNNPTGVSVSAETLKTADSWARHTGSAIVLDQCFALVSPSGQTAELGFNHLSDDLDWAVLWDTGKTISLRHEKLGVVFPSRPASPLVHIAMRQVSFDIAARVKRIVATLLRDRRWPRYVKTLSSKISANGSELMSAVGSENVSQGPFGSFALIRCASSEVRVIAATVLAKSGVALVPGEVFGLGVGQPQFLRVSLARETSFFIQALELARRELSLAVSARQAA